MPDQKADVPGAMQVQERNMICKVAKEESQHAGTCMPLGEPVEKFKQGGLGQTVWIQREFRAVAMWPQILFQASFGPL
eukprot:511367-Pelagomonas_calceolata.AAC.2